MRAVGNVLALLLVAAAALALVEAAARTLDGGGLPRLGLFRERDGRIELVPDATAAVRHPTGRVTTVTTDAHGCRVGGAPGGWIAVGDSQVLGLGVADDETFAARASAAGLPVADCGVPAFGVDDALARADRLAAEVPATGVLVVVGQLDDLDERRPAVERLAVRGGYLVRRDRAGDVSARVLASPLGRSHLVLGLLLAAERSASPAPAAALRDAPSLAADTDRVARAIEAFATDHRALRVAVALLPADLEVAPERGERSAAWSPGFAPGAWPTLRDALVARLERVRVVDLTPALAGRPDAFLDLDTHLSPEGHRLVADALREALE